MKNFTTFEFFFGKSNLKKCICFVLLTSKIHKILKKDKLFFVYKPNYEKFYLNLKVAKTGLIFYFSKKKQNSQV